MVDLTRKLIEHYLRATGWTLSDGEWLKQSDDAGYQHFSAEWIDTVGGLSLDVVVRMTGHSENLSMMAFRLGLCAAAEDALTRSKAYMVRGDTLLGLSKSADGYRLLAEVGIDPKAWEAARKQ